MRLVQSFQKAVQKYENWYLKDGQACVNWNFVDADCYMDCGNDYPDANSFYNEFNALCDVYCYTQNSHALQMKHILEVEQKKVDSVAA